MPDTVTKWLHHCPLPQVGVCVCWILLALPALLPVLPGAICHKDTELRCLAACSSAIFSEKWKNRDQISAAEPGGSQWKRWLEERWMVMQANSIQLKSYHITLFFLEQQPHISASFHPKDRAKRNLIFIAQPAKAQVQWHHWSTWGQAERTHPVLSLTLGERGLFLLSGFAISFCPCCQEKNGNQ